jgi:hypothetical protein
METGIYLSGGIRIIPKNVMPEITGITQGRIPSNSRSKSPLWCSKVEIFFKTLGFYDSTFAQFGAVTKITETLSTLSGFVINPFVII